MKLWTARFTVCNGDIRRRTVLIISAMTCPEARNLVLEWESNNCSDGESIDRKTLHIIELDNSIPRVLKSFNREE